jgi:hypothetical protein
MIKRFHRYFRGRWERFYIKNLGHLIFDLSLVVIIIALIAVSISLYSYRPGISWWSGFSGPEVDLDNPPLYLDFSLGANVLEGDQGVPLRVNFKNDGEAVISEASFAFSSLSPDISIIKLEADEAAGDSSLWHLDGRKLILSTIAPGKGGEANLKVYFKNDGLAGRNILWQAESEYIFSGKLFKKDLGLPAVVIAAQLNIDSVAYYTSPQGDQLGIGPLPPIVGIPTKYWIFWEASAEGDFNDLVMSARLPQGVELSGHRSLLAGDFSYNEDNRQIIWKVAKTESGADNYRLGFEVVFLPIEEQIASIYPLLSESWYRAQDTLSGEEAAGKFNEPTTDLSDDSFNRGHGRVIGQ